MSASPHAPTRTARTLLPILIVPLILLAGCIDSGAQLVDASGDDDPPAGSDTPTLENKEVEVTIIGDGEVTQTANGGLVTLHAQPHEGWVFAGWQGIPSGANPVTIFVDQAPAVVATFVPNEDSDGDGVPDGVDACVATPIGMTVDSDGCAVGQRDGDGDGVSDLADNCPGTPVGLPVDPAGCGLDQVDSDKDGYNDAIDECPGTSLDESADENGCGPSQRDEDDDGVPDSVDLCPDTGPGQLTDAFGCPIPIPDYSAVCGSGGSCFAEHAGGGCEVDDCCTAVCLLQSTCCDVGWDAGCASLALTYCAGIAEPECGNGVLELTEACDDGNTAAGDGCSPACAEEPPPAVCGNGVLDAGEQCDDGNSITGDGCSAQCVSEPGVFVCGNAVAEGAEECDDGNTVGGDGCSATCTLEEPTGPTTWSSTQIMFGTIDVDGFCMEPESYDLEGDGDLDVAHVTVDTASLQQGFGGTVTVVDDDIELGVESVLFTITGIPDPFGGPDGSLDLNVQIDTFELSVDGDTATWTFDFTQVGVLDFESLGGAFSSSYRLYGSQTGDIDSTGNQIVWDDVVGTEEYCDDFTPCMSNTLDPQILPAGTWTKD